MTLYIKNMVSLKCKLIVKEELRNLGLFCAIVGLGAVEILEEVSETQLESLRKKLFSWGLELQNDKKSFLAEKIKGVIDDMISVSDEPLKINYSDYISGKRDYDYTYLSNLFSEVNGITIQHYIIVLKIEKAKELLRYNDLNLTEISHKLHYSSVAHLSNQFKKITGLSPSLYKHSRRKHAAQLHNLQLAV
jgi:AraC-like DNA-binding protein